jgi:hypothetical protein
MDLDSFKEELSLIPGLLAMEEDNREFAGIFSLLVIIILLLLLLLLPVLEEFAVKALITLLNALNDLLINFAS